MLARHKVGVVKPKERRLYVKDNEHFGSLDAGFFWFAGRQFGCLVALVLLIMPVILLIYGLFVTLTNNPDYEWTYLPLDVLRVYTTIAILLFTPLLPFRLWLLISAIRNEQSIDRIIAQEEGDYNGAYKPKNRPSWQNLSPEKTTLKNYNYPNHAKDLRLLKLAHILVEKKNHPTVLSYGDIQDIKNDLINKDWWSGKDEITRKDHYLVMVALFKEQRAMQRLTRSLSRLKYHQPQKNVRLLLLLEESEHGAEFKRDDDQKIDRYHNRSEIIIKEYEKNLEPPKKKSADNFAQLVINILTYILRTLTRLVAYIFTPTVTYRWFSKDLAEQTFGNPRYYNPNKDNGRHHKSKIKMPVTTYQSAILNLLQLPDQTVDLEKKEYQDIRRSFVIAFVPNTGQLGTTHRQEAQTKPRALNYGIYQQFQLKQDATNANDNPSVTRNRAIHLQPFILSSENDYQNLEKLSDLFECLFYLATCYHEILPNKPYKNKEKIDEKWREKFQKGYHQQKSYRSFTIDVMRITRKQLKIDHEKIKQLEFSEWLNRFGHNLTLKLDRQIFSQPSYSNKYYTKIKKDVHETIKNCILFQKQKFESAMLDGNEELANFIKDEFERKLPKAIFAKLLASNATYTQFKKVVKQILKCKVEIRTLKNDKSTLSVQTRDEYYEEKGVPPEIFIENDKASETIENTGYLGGYLLRMLTGYHDRYCPSDKGNQSEEDQIDLDIDDLALLCLSQDIIKMWDIVHNILDKYFKYLKELNDDEDSHSPLQALLLPAFFDMDYRYQETLSDEQEGIFNDTWSPKYCAVYDAEDRPEEDQLLKSVYTYKFYEMLPMLLTTVIKKSLSVRLKKMEEIEENIKRPLSNEDGKTIQELKSASINLGLSGDEIEETLKMLRQDNPVISSHRIMQYHKDFDTFIANAQQLHYDLCIIEKNYKGHFPRQYEKLYTEQATEQSQHDKNREYFWWRAGRHLYDFLGKEDDNVWDNYVRKAYPERRIHPKKENPKSREYQHQIVCLQAKLTYENLNNNWLITLFKADYATWFNYILPGLHVHHLPIPLGGTSNHFDMSFLSKIGGWDSFNVAEDCDLGMWIARHGKHVAIVESITWEVANHDVSAWIKQHSRWNKGYMQSYFVHMRQPATLLRELGLKGFISFQLTIGAGFLLPMLSASFYAMTLIYILSLITIVVTTIAGTGTITTPLFFINDVHYYWILPFGTGSLFISNAIFFLILLIGHLRHPKPGALQFIVQWWWLYWIITVVASVRALYEYLFNPFHWVKSDHNYL
ncbi:MAG: glycosyltransferase family 2 protein [Chloroflexota bacterium]